MMKLRNRHLFAGTALASRRGWTPTELRVGRLLRGPDGHPGGDESGGAPAGGDSSGGTNNGGVNADSAAGGNDPNSGQAFDYSSFWAKPEGGDDDDDSGISPADSGKELGERLVSNIRGFKAQDVFTREALEKMGSGDLTDLNTGINTAFQSGMMMMLESTAQMMQSFENHFEARLDKLMQDRIEGSRTSDRDEKLLSESFKAFSNPAVRPMIQGIFAKSLEHSGGDRQKALKLTRGMLETFGRQGKEDLGLGNLRNPDDNMDEGPSRLVQQLLELKG